MKHSDGGSVAEFDIGCCVGRNMILIYANLCYIPSSYKVTHALEFLARKGKYLSLQNFMHCSLYYVWHIHMRTSQRLPTTEMLLSLFNHLKAALVGFFFISHI
jgi:hypothetical protein